MKKFLLLMIALLAGVSGTWAASPAAGAYPVEGKTYYLFANKYNSTDRYYLYWDNTNSVLKHATANSKENTDYYKWTVTVSDGQYTITNVGTGTNLKWNSGLTLGAEGLQFDLSKEVNYSACVSLYATIPDGGRWLCVKNDTETFANGYKYTAFGNYTDYSINFVFEEVLPAHSLTDGSYYTIYCDNDSKQYLWDNNGTLTISSETPEAAALSCIWKCIVNGDYYNFQNYATGKYLGWKALSGSAYNFALETTDVYHDGCIKLKGVANSAYMGMTTAGTFDNASHPRFPKVTTNYSFDWRFDAVTPSVSITSLPTTITKSYVIVNARGTWNFTDDATSMSVATAPTKPSNDEQQIALIYKNSEYYLFSVNAGKYLTASNSLTSMPTDNEQVDIVATGNDTYPWFFRFKNYTENDKYTKNINVSAGTVFINGYGPNGSNENGTLDAGNINAIIEAADFDATQALEMFEVRNVTYNLSYGGNATFRTVADVTTTIGGDPADFVPSSFVIPGVSLSYSPATIGEETTEVTVTATWNGPFEYAASFDALTAKWYTVGIHSSYKDSYHYIWTFNGSDNVIPQSVANNNYSGVTNERLFCFVGNPYDGFKIYNKAAGDGYTLRKNGENVQATMSSTDDNNLYVLKQSRTNELANGYFCLKPTVNNHYLNFDQSNTKLGGWDDNDQGSTCWVVAPSQYPYNYLNGLVLNAPNGAVGTKNVSTSMMAAATSLKTTLDSTPFYYADADNRTTANETLDALAAASIITLTDGYYRIQNAYTSWYTTAPTIYYNSSTDKIEWSIASNTSNNINSIFKIDASTPTIYSPNAQKYMSVINSDVRGELAAEAGTTVFTSLGNAQYNILVGGGTMHTAGHNSGAGISGTLTHWDGVANTASAWYILPVSTISLDLHEAGDGKFYATLCLPFDVTIDGATAYTLTLGASKTYLHMEAVEDGVVAAGTPVLLRGESASATAHIAANAATGAPLTTTALTGVYVNTTDIDGENDYFLGLDEHDAIGFYHWEGTTLNANRAYLVSDGSFVKGFALNFDLETAVDALNAQEAAQGSIFNLAGQRMNKLQRGVNILNGKKVIVK